MSAYIIFTILLLFLSYISFFAFYLLFWLIVSLFYKPDEEKYDTLNLNRFAIIIPAHNEELLIGQLLGSANKIDYPGDLYQVIVIADNCNDRTEHIAKEKGAHCFSRTDTKKKGKPYALEWIFKQIDIDKYDGFVIVDADSTIGTNFLRVMNYSLNQGSQIIQGYFGILNPDESWLTRLMVIPGVLKYYYRYRGKKIFNFTCPLMGNGMCFSRQIIKQYGWDALSLTENWEYYIKSVIRGHIPTYAEAYIYSQTASTTKQGAIQRKRWFKGKLQCVKNYILTLIILGIKRKDLKFFDCAIELIMPSISMMQNFSILLSFISFLLFMSRSEFLPLLVWSLILQTFIFGYFVFGIAMNHSSRETWMALGKAPFFLIWKIVTTSHAIFTFKNQEWIKTKRKR